MPNESLGRLAAFPAVCRLRERPGDARGAIRCSTIGSSQRASERVNASDVFALSPEMQRFLNVEIAPDLRNKGNRDGLIDAMYREGQLKIEYDSVMTRNAAQAFAARSGNCLSLVIMTAAFAKALGLPVQFQSVSVDETVSRSEDIYFFIGHVNLTLGNRSCGRRLHEPARPTC